MLCLACNTFIKQLDRSQGSLPTDYAISFLSEYLNYHHRNEEALMLEVKYDRIGEHLHGHRVIESKLSELKAHSLKGKCIKKDVLSFFTTRLLRHMTVEDHDIGVYLRSEFRHALYTTENAASEVSALGARHRPYDSKCHCITNRDGRIFARYEVNLTGRIVTEQGHALRVVVENLSQGGACLDCSTGLFKGARGVLRMPTTDLPDLNFVVVRVHNNRANIQFTLSSGMQLAFAKKLMSTHKKSQAEATMHANWHNQSSEPQFNNDDYSDM